MDKKNTIIGIILLVTAFALMFWQGNEAKRIAEDQQRRQAAQEVLTQQVEQVPLGTVESSTPPAAPDAASTSGNGLVGIAAAQAPTLGQLVAPANNASEELYTLENDYIRVTFSNRGGSIKNVAFIHRDPATGKLKYPATLGSDEPYLFNTGASLPALAISLDPFLRGTLEEFAPPYQLIKKTDSSILFSYRTPEGVVITRGYAIDGDNSQAPYQFPDPYTILHETRLNNESQAPLPLNSLWINVGMAPPTKGDVMGEFLNFGYFDGIDAEFIKMSNFGSRGFLGIGSKPKRDSITLPVDPVIWGSVKNQFFAAVLTPDIPGTGIYAHPQNLIEGVEDPEDQRAIGGSVQFDLGLLPAGGEKLIGLQYYVGPKEYKRLATLGKEQDEVMQFGFFSGISKLLLLVMIWIHGLIYPLSPSWAWGWSIIVITIIIKGCLWPLTQVQVRSAKRMSKIQAPLQEIREKYKDNQQLLMQKQMELFKQNRINPAAGCLPVIIQIPIFFALFFMLRTSSELRFAHFLWIQDLALPDTVATIAGFPLNIMPLFMAAAMVIQMRMTPTPTTDNFQRKVFQMMPIIFLVFCYNFPSGLVLYWTCQNLISIFQQWITNRRKDDDDAPKPTAADIIRQARDQENSGKKRGPKTTPPSKKRKR